MKSQPKVAWLHKTDEALTWALFESLGSEFYVVVFSGGSTVLKKHMPEPEAQAIWERLAGGGWERDIPNSSAVERLRIRPDLLTH